MKRCRTTTIATEFSGVGEGAKTPAESHMLWRAMKFAALMAAAAAIGHWWGYSWVTLVIVIAPHATERDEER